MLAGRSTAWSVAGAVTVCGALLVATASLRSCAGARGSRPLWDPETPWGAGFPGTGTLADVWLGMALFAAESLDAVAARDLMAGIAADGEAHAVPVLCSMLRRPERALRVAAAEALGTAVSEFQHRGLCSDTLLAGCLAALAEERDPAVASVLVGYLGQLADCCNPTEAWAPSLVVHLTADADPGLKASVLELLAELGSVAGAAVPALTDLAGSGDEAVQLRVHAALVAAGSDSEGHLDQLLRVATDPTAGPVATEACRLIGRLGPMAESVGPALGAALGQGDVWPKLDALQAVGRAGPEGRFWLRTAIADWDDWRERLIQVTGALVAEPDGALQILLDAYDREAQSRVAAARALGTLGVPDQRVVARLVELARSADTGERLAAVGSLGALGDARPDVLDALIGAAGDREEAIRGEAATALGHLGTGAGRVVPVLMQLAGRDTEGVRRAAIAALGCFGQDARAAVPMLVDLLSSRKALLYLPHATRAVVRIDPNGGTLPSVLRGLPATVCVVEQYPFGVRVQTPGLWWAVAKASADEALADLGLPPTEPLPTADWVRTWRPPSAGTAAGIPNVVQPGRMIPSP
jgi:HEAT repeat protein